jgi:hypothetical protein
MRFLAPLGFLFAISLPVIVVFYLLKLRRVRRDVPSTLLWRRAAEDLHANAPFQKLRKNLLLLLQLAVAALLVIGLARPYLNLKAGRSRNTIILIDHSASMNATDAPNNQSRLSQARQSAISYVRGMQSGDSAMVISFADKAMVREQFTNDKAILEHAISSIEATDLPTLPSDAFSLAQSLARPLQATLRIYSDGAFANAQIQLASNTKCEFVPIGTSANNVGLVTLDIRRPPENSKEYQVFATIRNYTDKPRTVRLEILNGARLIDAKSVKLAANSDNSQLFSSSQLGLGRVEIRIADGDDFKSDDAAYAVIKPPRKRTLLLVTLGNYFLEHALREDASHQFELTKISPSQYSPVHTADVVVFDNFAPPGPLAAGNYFFINAKPPLQGFEETGTEENPAIFDWDQQHAVMRYIELGDVRINRAKKFRLPSASHILAESRETPLMSIYFAEGRNIVLWSFDIFETNLPYRIAFPLMVSNSLDWLIRDTQGTESNVIAAGNVIQIEAPRDFRRGAMTDPEKHTWILAPNSTGHLLFDRTGLSGFYTAEINGKAVEEFGVSLVNAAESDIAPRQSLALQSGNQVTGHAHQGYMNREVWKWFILAALTFLVLEWLVYHRRVFV